MNLGDELRAVLNQEADMQITTGPDVDRLIVGGRVRRRRRTANRAGGVALALVLVGGGALAVTQGGNETGGTGITTKPTTTAEPFGVGAPPTLAPNAGASGLTPGTYRILVGGDAEGLPIEADLTIEGAGWWAGNFPVLKVGSTHGGFGVYRPSALGAGSGCEVDPPNADLGSSPQALAQQLAGLPQSTILKPITPTEAFGHSALHLRVRIRDTCALGDLYRVAETPRGTRGISYSDTGPDTEIVDFWVLDFEGVPVVVDSWHQAGTWDETINRIAQARDSITFVTNP